MSLWSRILDEEERDVLWRIGAYLKRTGRADLRIYERPTSGPYAEIVWRFWLEPSGRRRVPPRLMGQADVTLRQEADTELSIKVTQVT